MTADPVPVDPAAADPAAARSVAALDRGARLAGRADARIWPIGASVATLSNAVASMATRRG